MKRVIRVYKKIKKKSRRLILPWVENNIFFYKRRKIFKNFVEFMKEMKYFDTILFLLLSSCWREGRSYFVSWSQIEPSKINICSNCQYSRLYPSVESEKKYKKGSLPSSSQLSSPLYCSLFGKINLINGNIVYTPCWEVRNTSNQCGKEGRFYRHYLDKD